jgi:hypothetical protein
MRKSKRNRGNARPNVPFGTGGEEIRNQNPKPEIRNPKSEIQNPMVPLD